MKLTDNLLIVRCNLETSLLVEDFSLIEIQPYLFILIGIGCILITLFKKSDKAALKVNGEKAEGIIYSLEQKIESNGSIDYKANIKDKVTIRFLTKDKQWITADLKQDFAVYFTNQYKEGEAVDVYYDPKQPSNFFVDKKQSEKASRILFAIVGIIFIGIGLYKLLVHQS